MLKKLFTSPVTISSLISFCAGLLLPVDIPSSLASLSTVNNNFGENIVDFLEIPKISDKINQNFDIVIQKIEAEEKEQKKINDLKMGVIPTNFQGKIIEEIPLKNNPKIVALTFDDGPWPDYTNHILYVLDKYQVKATFFILGRNAQNYPSRLQQIAIHGHALGNHSWSHPYSYQNPTKAAQEIEKTNQVIQQFTGIKTSIFRPPGGILNNGLVHYAKQKNNAIIMWSADSLDYRSPKETILNNLLKNTNSGGILLMHDGGGNRWHTLVALPYLISELKNRGYQFVTVPELLTMAENQ